MKYTGSTTLPSKEEGVAANSWIDLMAVIAWFEGHRRGQDRLDRRRFRMELEQLRTEKDCSAFADVTTPPLDVGRGFQATFGNSTGALPWQSPPAGRDV
jgi:hypothetical protein